MADGKIEDCGTVLVATREGPREMPCCFRRSGIAVVVWEGNTASVTHERTGRRLAPAYDCPEKAVAVALMFLKFPVAWTGSMEEVRAAVAAHPLASAFVAACYAGQVEISITAAQQPTQKGGQA